VIQGRSVAAILFVRACATVSGFLAGTVAMYFISKLFDLTPMLPRIEILGSMATAIVCFAVVIPRVQRERSNLWDLFALTAFGLAPLFWPVTGWHWLMRQHT
jgi:hypothetical protein